jgi:hypothetical protein
VNEKQAEKEKLKDQVGMVIDEKIVGIWYVRLTETSEWMAALRELVADEKYELVGRFRYYKDDQVFDSKDEKSWFRGTATGTRNYCILGLRETAKSLEALSGRESYEIVNDHGLEEFQKEFMKAPFVYVRQV